MTFRLRALAVLAGAALSLPAQTADCASCHDVAAKLKVSAHASVSCTACHPKHAAYPHPKAAARAACGSCHQRESGEHARSVHGMALKRGEAAAPDCAVCHGGAHDAARARSPEFRKAVPETCGGCHADISREFVASVHGQALNKGVVQAPVCTDCHGEHSIQAHTLRTSPVHPSHIRETCAACHANVRLSRKFGMPSDRVVSFDASFHGLAAKAGSQTVANCASCHGVHSILPSTDPASTIHPKKLAQTCGHCHTGAGTRFAKLGPVHLWEGRVEPVSVRWVRQVYQVLIPALIGLMLLHNAGDWLRKLRHMRFLRQVQRPAPPPLAPPIRMYPFERVLHALLAVSFVVLAWTGFQLKYPDQWWARPLLQWEEQVSVRGIIHRVASVVFLLAAVLHFGSLIWSSKLRRHWLHLLPRYTDVGQALSSFAYSLGLTSRKPRLSPYSFIEKAEYWAVVWGGVVMGASGLLLWANTWALSRLPKEALDFATALHFYEAVLACLAIVVWHLYMVIFDPEVYPIDTAWLTGRSVRRHEEEGEEARAGAAAGRW